MNEREVRDLVRDEFSSLIDDKLGPLLERLESSVPAKKGGSEKIQVSVPKSQRVPVKRLNGKEADPPKVQPRKHKATPRAVRDMLAERVLSLFPYFTIGEGGVISPTIPDSLEESAELLEECYGFIQDLMLMHNVQMVSKDGEFVLDPIDKRGIRKSQKSQQLTQPKEEPKAVVEFDDEEEFGFGRP